MKVIGFYNQKGGVGKTSTCIHLSAVFAKKGYKVAVVDWDSQINTTQFFLYQNENYFLDGEYIEDNNNIQKLLAGDCSAQECVVYRGFTRTTRAKKAEYEIGVIPGTPQLNYLNFESIYCLKKQLANLENEFDFIFIDLSPSDSTAIAIGLAACDYVICPSEAELDSMTGCKKVYDIVDDINFNYEANIKVLGSFIDRFVKTRTFQQYVQEQFLDGEDAYWFKTAIPNDPRIPESRACFIPLETYARSCPANKAFHKLADEILKKIKE